MADRFAPHSMTHAKPAKAAARRRPDPARAVRAAARRAQGSARRHDHAHRGRGVPDLAVAKVFFTTLGDAESLARTEAGLTRAAGFLRAQLARRLKLRIAPELRFHHDASVERGVRLSQLIDAAVTGKKT